MKAFFDAVLAFFTGKLNLRTLLFGTWITASGFQMAVSIAYKFLLLMALAFFINYIVRIWTLFSDLINSFQTLGISVGGTSFGISNSQIVNSFWGFVHASGLDDVIKTSGSLFMALVLSFFGIQAYKLVVGVTKELYGIVINATLSLPKPS